MKIVLTGEPGIGKTTIIKKVAEVLGDKAIGFYTEEFRDIHGKREGFKIITLDGKEGILASKKLISLYRIGSYGVNLKEFEDLVLPVLEKAKSQDKIVIIDEIGKMELFSEKFARLIDEIFSLGKDIIATVPLKNVHPVISRIKRNPEVHLIEVNFSNRDKLPEQIIKVFEKE
ncbi:NTPase [Persephonella sp.]|uniref:NTPase n=1 Tax=Persephonella sp. TaxID=2060922 RepID=UPI00262D9183|nr:NTPase [Persephonella sp.]